MRSDRPYPSVYIDDKGKRQQESGHPWVYGNEIVRVDGLYANGDIVDVRSAKGRYLGSGFINDRSKIAVRVLSRNANDRFDEDFFERRLRYAWEYRKTVMPDDLSCCRIVFGDADFFPGLIVDRFNDLLSVQVLSYGIETRKDMLFRLLLKILREDGQEIRGIYERNDVAVRLLEGMEEKKGFYPIGEPPAHAATQITENGIRYRVDVENGQKTGFFLDQKYNRRAVAGLTRGRTVLDCFTHTGSFALNAAKGGAKRVVAVDISAAAIETAEENCRLNGLTDIVSFQTADVFDFLQTVESRAFDFIILDPPAFTKSRKTIDAAARGYKRINAMAMRALPRGGYLATCSCSHFMSGSHFLQVVDQAAREVGRTLRQVEKRQQAPDHPILPDVAETDYLKFFIFQVV